MHGTLGCHKNYIQRWKENIKNAMLEGISVKIDPLYVTAIISGLHIWHQWGCVGSAHGPQCNKMSILCFIALHK